MRIAYLCSRYPAVSLTFIQREVQALRARSLEIETFAVRRAKPHEVLSRTDREEFARTYAILPPRLGDFLRAHATALLRRRGGYLRTLRWSLGLSPGGVRPLLWRLFYFAEAAMLWRECERRGVRHIHAHLANVGCDLAMIAARLGGDGWSWSFTMHGSTEFFDVHAHRLPDKAGDARFVVCVSDFTRSQLLMWIPTEEWGKLRVIRCGVDVELFRRGPDPSPGERFRVLSVTRLVPGKGMPFLLDALAALIDRGVDAELVVVGDGPERQQFVEQARRLGIADRVELAGAVGQDEIRQHYASANAFCLPSFAEGVPVVLMEAMAFELPAVATRITGVPELIEDGRSGLLVTPARADELADALERLANSPELRQSIGAAARERVVGEFNIQRSADQLVRLYREALGTEPAVGSPESAPLPV
jgi:glycosyltransferase involved in cell wall biosynthesis